MNNSCVVLCDLLTSLSAHLEYESDGGVNYVLHNC